MSRTSILQLVAVSALLFFAPMAVEANEEDKAKDLCKDTIRDVYGHDRFKNTWADKTGNHKFEVHGQVKVRDHKYDFQCKVKNGNVKSYAYHGPHDRHSDDDDLGKAVAVGAGLAIAAAIIASSDDDDSKLPAKSVLEDDCHDLLQYRIRDEHDRTAEVVMKESRLKGQDLSGDAKVKYHHGSPHHAQFTCHFDGRGHLLDSSYRLH